MDTFPKPLCPPNTIEPKPLSIPPITYDSGLISTVLVESNIFPIQTVIVDKYKFFALGEPTYSEVQVYRSMKFMPHRIYKTAIYTREEGKYPNEIYFTTNPIVIVGTHIKQICIGSGDAGRGWEYFNHNGKEIHVEYTYEGTTTFLEGPYDYESMEKRMNIFKEELLEIALHPDRIEYWLNNGKNFKNW